MVVSVFLTSTTVVFNHFAEGSQIQTYDFVRKPHKQILLQANWHVLFYCTIDMFCFSLLHKILEVLLKGAASRKESIRSKESDTKPVVPNRGAIYNIQGCRELIRFSIYHWKDIFKMSPNLKPNCYACRKLYFSFVGCRKAKKVWTTALLSSYRTQSIYFAYEVGIISSYSNRICYRKIAKSRTKDAWELHAALRTVFENHFL